jgi:hypothetical protein
MSILNGDTMKVSTSTSIGTVSLSSGRLTMYYNDRRMISLQSTVPASQIVTFVRMFAVSAYYGCRITGENPSMMILVLCVVNQRW